MNTTQNIDPKALQAKAGEVAGILSALANDRRLLILCKLVEVGEATVGTLAAEV
jgi:ArsR family transcriptional regulator